MKVHQSRSFEKKVKKFTSSQKIILDKIVLRIINNPDIGEQKKGDLKGIFIYKFKLGNTLHLLVYRYSKSLLELIMIGTHENYYRDLKSYIKHI